MDIILSVIKSITTFEAAFAAALIMGVMWWMERTERRKILKELTVKIERLAQVLESNKEILKLLVMRGDRRD